MRRIDGTALDLFNRLHIPEPMSGCWLWIGACNNKTHYGSMNFRGKTWRASRFIYEHTYGKFDIKLYVLHKCDNPACVNPEHLYLGTQKQNVKDMFTRGRHNSGNAKKTHCPKGHGYTEDNTFIQRRPGIFGDQVLRHCRRCRKEFSRANNAKLKAERLAKKLAKGT